jgi:ribonucleotide monophosphatase NagD (HAD superfamily)
VAPDIRCAVIGDALTDIAAGRAVGARTVLMLTGVTSRAMAEELPLAERPTRIAEDGPDLALGGARRRAAGSREA